MRKLSRLDPAEMQRWSEQPCLIDQRGAFEIAKRLLHRLGFDETEFEPIEVGRYSWQPSEAAPEHILRPPLYWVRSRLQGTSPQDTEVVGVRMDISGTTGRLVYYSDYTGGNLPLAGLIDSLRTSPK